MSTVKREGYVEIVEGSILEPRSWAESPVYYSHQRITDEQGSFWRHAAYCSGCKAQAESFDDEQPQLTHADGCAAGKP